MEKETKKTTYLQIIQNFKRTFKMVWVVDRRNTSIFILVVGVLAFLPTANGYLWGQFINSVVKYLGGSGIELESIYLLFGGSLLITAMEFILWKLSSHYNMLLWFSLHAHMYVEIPRKISHLDIQRFEDSKFKTLIHKVNDGSGYKPANFAEKSIWTLYHLISMITSLTVIVAFNIWLLPIIVFSLLPALYVLIKFSKETWGIWDAKGDISRMVGHNAEYLYEENYIKEVKVFRLQNYILNRLKDLFTEFQKEHINILSKKTGYTLLAGLLELSVNIGVNIWLLTKVLAAKSSFGLGDFTFMHGSIYRFTDSVRIFLGNMAQLYENNLYMTDLFKLFDTPSLVPTSENPILLPTDSIPAIQFKNVSFKYPGTKVYVFRDLDLTINPGEDIAIVGENGAGKTTLIKLLLRFYDVTDGEILINGVNIKEISIESLYYHIGVLFQTFNKYYYPVSENISVGRVEEKPTKSFIEKCAEQAGAHKFIKEYPKGYKQLLNRSFDDAIEPSGGQWQRIALARAFYRNAGILILDEPTSAIDAKGEYEIFKEISKIQKEKTTIIISHRFSTVRNADKIYVIEEGKIIEQGSHPDLLNLPNGKYKQMFELQAEGYK